MLTLKNKIWSILKNDYTNKKWIKFISEIVIGLAIIMCVFTVLYWIIYFIVVNLEAIVTVIGSFVIIAIIVWGLVTNKESAPPPKQKAGNVLQYDPITLEHTYVMLRKHLCTILGEVSDVVKLRKPATLSQMDAPVHYDIVAQTPIYHYLALKIDNSIELYDMVGILQTTIEQKLSNHELDGMPQAYSFINGQAYPILMVDSVRDMGKYVQIDLAIVSNAYCKYREQRIYNNMNQTGTVRPIDKEF